MQVSAFTEPFHSPELQLVPLDFPLTEYKILNYTCTYTTVSDPWKNNFYVYRKKKSRRIPPEDRLHDFLDVLFYICQIAYNNITLLFYS